MSVEIEFPLEFVVAGTPVSAQATNRASIPRWQAQIVAASRSVLPEGHFASASPMAVTLYYFPSTPMQGDIDNIVKPILDAMCRHIYLNDHQVERLLVQKFEPGRVPSFASLTTTLLAAVEHPKPLLYIRLSDNPLEDFER
jgi:hypothetical protein